MELRNASAFDQLDALLAQGKITDEEYRDLWNALKGPRAEAAPEPEKRGHFRRLWYSLWHVPPATGRKIAVDVWLVAQIVGLGGIIAGEAWICIVSAVSSFSLYLTAPKESRLIRRVALAAAIVGTIVIGIDMRIGASDRAAAVREIRTAQVSRPAGIQPWQIGPVPAMPAQPASEGYFAPRVPAPAPNVATPPAVEAPQVPPDSSSSTDSAAVERTALNLPTAESTGP